MICTHIEKGGRLATLALYTHMLAVPQGSLQHHIKDATLQAAEYDEGVQLRNICQS